MPSPALPEMRLRLPPAVPPIDVAVGAAPELHAEAAIAHGPVARGVDADIVATDRVVRAAFDEHAAAAESSR